MMGVHSLWSKPYFYKNNDADFFLQDYDILVMVLSALKWKQKNGKIILYADDFATDFVKKNNIDIFYDEIRFLSVDEEIRPNIFWAAGKIYSLKRLENTGVLLDIDMIVWKNLEDYFEEYDVIAMHEEELLERTYKGKNYFKMKHGYQFPKEFNWSVLPVNTAMLYIKNDDFKSCYINSSINFMKNTLENEDSLSYMVFAEQRLLSMCADAKGINIKKMLKFPQAIGSQKCFTHLWGYKNILFQSKEVRDRFCKRVGKRLKTDFPERLEDFKKINKIQKYI